MPAMTSLAFSAGAPLASNVELQRTTLPPPSPGSTVNVGGTNYVATGNEYLNADVKIPKVTPYVGIGWGHHRREPGWGFLADLGVSIGKAKLDVDTNLASYGVSQADIDREVEDLKDDVGKVRVVPQLSLGVSYRF